MKTVFFAALGAASLTAAVHADLVGFTASVRTVSGGYLVNVFAVVNNANDKLVNMSGGVDGFISTTSAGGFLQSAANPTFQPNGAQSWSTLDSFLTVGGGYNATTGNFSGAGATIGDVPWNVTYFDTDAGGNVTVSAFGTASNETGFTNRYTDNIPLTGGWYLGGPPYAQARNLSVLGASRLFSSSTAAATENAGFMVAQLYVAELSLPGTRGPAETIEWRMKATVQRADGSADNQLFQFTIGVPAPGALAILGIAGLTASRRRR